MKYQTIERKAAKLQLISTKMANVVVISDSEDTEDCVIESVFIESMFVEDDTKENNSELYYEVRKENVLLAEFIRKCLSLENTKYMMAIMKRNLLQSYYNADKLARESPKFQKNLRRANYLLNTQPELKYTHIKDLCKILETYKVKKKVPFVTLATNLEDKKSNSNELKRCSTEKLDAISGTSKKAKIDGNNISPFSETGNISFNDTSCDTLDESQNLDLSSQQSCLSEEDVLLVERKSTNVEQSMAIDKRIKAIDNKIAFYKKRIAILDQMEVHIDSVRSPYIRSERLKTKIVSLYNELCQLKCGINMPVKRKGLRLKLTEGHPPGPTRVLERFLNKNFNSDGDPSFPDFCDVVTCVSEANEKDDLGWTRAQIMKEASLLFTLCGRALQKRRQNREYRDLMYRVRFDEVDKDPADDDPGLQAVLEENRRIAIKKESDVLERYTMMQYLPPKTKAQKSSSNNENTGKENVSDAKLKTDTEQEIVNNNGGVKNEISQREGYVGENSAFKSSDNNTSNVKLAIQANQVTAGDHNYVQITKTNAQTEKKVSESFHLHDGRKNLQDAKYCNNNKSKTVSKDTNHKIIPVSKFKDKNDIPCGNATSKNRKDNNVIEKDEVTAIENKKSSQVLDESQIKQKPKENVMGLFNKLANDFTVTIEIMSDS